MITTSSTFPSAPYSYSLDVFVFCSVFLKHRGAVRKKLGIDRPSFSSKHLIEQLYAQANEDSDKFLEQYEQEQQGETSPSLEEYDSFKETIAQLRETYARVLSAMKEGLHFEAKKHYNELVFYYDRLPTYALQLRWKGVLAHLYKSLQERNL